MNRDWYDLTHEQRKENFLKVIKSQEWTPDLNEIEINWINEAVIEDNHIWLSYLKINEYLEINHRLPVAWNVIFFKRNIEKFLINEEVISREKNGGFIVKSEKLDELDIDKINFVILFVNLYIESVYVYFNPRYTSDYERVSELTWWLLDQSFQEEECYGIPRKKKQVSFREYISVYLRNRFLFSLDEKEKDFFENNRISPLKEKNIDNEEFNRRIVNLEKKIIQYLISEEIIVLNEYGQKRINDEKLETQSSKELKEILRFIKGFMNSSLLLFCDEDYEPFLSNLLKSEVIRYDDSTKKIIKINPIEEIKKVHSVRAGEKIDKERKKTWEAIIRKKNQRLIFFNDICSKVDHIDNLFSTSKIEKIKKKIFFQDDKGRKWSPSLSEGERKIFDIVRENDTSNKYKEWVAETAQENISIKRKIENYLLLHNLMRRNRNFFIMNSSELDELTSEQVKKHLTFIEKLQKESKNEMLLRFFLEKERYQKNANDAIWKIIEVEKRMPELRFEPISYLQIYLEERMKKEVKLFENDKVVFSKKLKNDLLFFLFLPCMIALLILIPILFTLMNKIVSLILFSVNSKEQKK